jgi:putative intracellular protease/amidase
MACVLIPVPERDFDPTEVAVSWKVLTDAGHSVLFATPTGAPAVADDIMVTGEGLDPWGWIPGLRKVVLAGRLLRADTAGRAAYAAMAASTEFTHPISWVEIELGGVDGLLLPGGHRARGMRQYLESEHLRVIVVDAFRRALPVAAVCHGVLVAARSVDPSTGRSVLYGRKTTALTWSLERRGANVGRIVRFWDPGYYRTYPDGHGARRGYMSVQAEVTRALASPTDFVDVDGGDPEARRKTDGRHRDRVGDERSAHVVLDGDYISARWPGDVHTFARRFAALLSERQSRQEH